MYCVDWFTCKTRHLEDDPAGSPAGKIERITLRTFRLDQIGMIDSNNRDDSFKVYLGGGQSFELEGEAARRLAKAMRNYQFSQHV